MEASVEAVETLINYKFTNRSLLEEALTHRSYANFASYERLEFIGDAALGCALSNYIFLAYTSLDQHQLTLLRSVNLSTEKLARVAVRLGLYQYVRRSSGSLDEQVREFTLAVQQEDDWALYGGSVRAPKVLADIVESLAAAVYVDCNFNLEVLWVVFRGLLEPIVTHEALRQQPQPVTLLYDLCQKDGKHVDLQLSREGAKNIARVYVSGKLIALGSSESKDIAKLNGANEALRKLSSEPNDVEMTKRTIEINQNLEINQSIEIDGAKQKLYELCGKMKWPRPIYRKEKEEGLPHDKKFVYSVRIDTPDGILSMLGDTKPRVKDAENTAASLMIHFLNEAPSSFQTLTHVTEAKILSTDTNAQQSWE